MTPFPISVPPGCPFTLAHIPFGIFTTTDNVEKRIGAAIGEYVVDISVLEQSPSFLEHAGLGELRNDLEKSPISRHGDLGALAKLPASVRARFRRAIQSWLGDGGSPLFTDVSLNKGALVPMATVIMHRPFKISNFADFMCADVHVENCSKIAGATTPPGHYAMPLGYYARPSSVGIETEPVYRPHGFRLDPKTSSISYGPSQRIDYEAEIGFFVSQPLPRGKFITADEASEYIFGAVVLNDWSARDIQFTEMTPLGPFNGKAFATSISPWVTTLDALESSKCASSAADARLGGSAGVAHLKHTDEISTWDLELEVIVTRPGSNNTEPLLKSHSHLRDLRWSPCQMLAHLASSGCGLETGDLFGTGTISSPNDAPHDRTLGCLIELTEGGRKPLGVSDDARLTFLEDGDVVTMNVWNSARTVGLGSLSIPLARSERP